MRLHNIFLTTLLLSTLTLLSACSSGDDNFTTAPSDSSSTSTDTTTDTAGDTDNALASAVTYRGAIDLDPNYPVVLAAFSILDGDGQTIDHLDGGDFFIDPEDAEAHHDAHKLDYETHVNGAVVLMLDISEGMVSTQASFTALKDAAKSMVTQVVGLGLLIDVYTFDTAETYIGTVAGYGDPATVNAAIDALSPGASPTDFDTIIANRITSTIAPSVSYTHADPATPPAAFVPMIVIMSDGRDNAEADASIDQAKDKVYTVTSIAVGEDPDESALDSISELLFTVPEGGTYTDAVNEAAATLANYYKGFYLVDYNPINLVATDDTYSISLVDNPGVGRNVTYTADYTGFPDIPPYCCEIYVEPSVATDPVTLPAGTAIEFQAVELWDNFQPNITWALTNADGGLTLAQSGDNNAIATIQSNGSASTGTLTASEPVSGWSRSIVISVP